MKINESVVSCAMVLLLIAALTACGSIGTTTNQPPASGAPIANSPSAAPPASGTGTGSGGSGGSTTGGSGGTTGGGSGTGGTSGVTIGSGGLSGNWTGRFAVNLNPVPGHDVDATIRGPLSQSGGTITSTGLALDSQLCFAAVLVQSGTVSGTTVKMDMFAADFAGISFNATLSGNDLTGSIQVDGSQCGSGSGTLSMTKVPPVTGTWSGILHNDATGLDSPLTISLTQTSTIINMSSQFAPFDLSSLRVTGIIQQAGSGCLLQVGTVTPGFVGSIQGLPLTLKSSGSPGIALKGAVNASATSFTGTYKFSGTSCDGETGTFTLKKM